MTEPSQKTPSPTDTPTRRGTLAELAAVFGRLGSVAFGGPAAHIAMMEDEVVSRRGWLSRQHFLDLVGATHLVPGPNSTEMTMHVGFERAGWRGLLVAGWCFILPAATLTAIFAWLYVSWGTVPRMEPVLAGIRAVVVAVILAALLKLGRKALKTWRLSVLGALVIGAVAYGWDEVLALLAGGLVGGLWLALTSSDPPKSAERDEATGRDAPTAPEQKALPPIPTALALTAGGSASAAVSLSQLGLFFLKVGAVLYGSGYVLVAFLEGDLVQQRGWLSEGQLLDAIAVGQLTPGPVLTTATFIGFLLLGPKGAAVATLAIFLPSFVFVTLLNPIVPRLRDHRLTAAFLDAVNVSAVALMAAVTADLARASLTSLPAWALTAGAAVALVRFRAHAAWLVLVGGLVGWSVPM
ncbi:MAG: chromate efflux transporter [Thermoanaerobaculia bacterium]|nr:chromate efflux transporter [Thermoanaerobaculia bacterium]